MTDLSPTARPHYHDLLGKMHRVRRLEETCAEMYSAQKIRGFLHLYIGEEAIAVGTIPQLRPEDKIFCTYREHGHALIRGLSANSIMAEMFGKVEGCCRGRGGSMHLFSAAHNFLGGNAIVAGALPVACGTGLADKMLGRNYLSACYFGEGAMAEGEFHEAMNLAELWKLPVIFICENNLYAMGTAIIRSESQTDLCLKARSYNIESASVDGMDVLAVEDAMRKAVSFVRSRSEPYFLECKTYRFRAHSMFDPELYRDHAEVEKWMERDPIKLFTERLANADLVTEADLLNLIEQAAVEMRSAVSFAEAGNLEPFTDLERHVYFEQVP